MFWMGLGVINSVAIEKPLYKMKYPIHKILISYGAKDSLKSLLLVESQRLGGWVVGKLISE